MTGVVERFGADYPQRARGELAEAWEHLVTAAEYGSRQAGAATRRRGTLARRRAALAALALRGELPRSAWRPAAAGLAIGVVLGAAATLILRRRLAAGPGPEQPEPGHEPAPAGAVRQRAAAAAGRLREQSSAMVHGATEAARDGVARIRDQVTGGDRPEQEADPSGQRQPVRDRSDSASG